MRYKLEPEKVSVVTSAYCPVCCKKTIEVVDKKIIFVNTVDGFDGVYDGFVLPKRLCCSEKCQEEYVKRIAEAVLDVEVVSSDKVKLWSINAGMMILKRREHA